MTPLLRKVIEFLAEKPPGVNVVRAITDQEDLLKDLMVEGKVGKAMHVIEPDKPAKFGVFPVPDNLKGTPFTHFLDGIQHARLLFYIKTEYGFLPVVYGYVATVALERRDRHLHPTPDFWQEEEALYLPRALMDTSALEMRNIRLHDIFDRSLPDQIAFAAALQKASGTVARIRDQQERAMVLKWLEQFGDSGKHWLVVDGSISDVIKAQSERRFLPLVGVSKTHHTAYLKPDDLIQVCSMKAYFRSSLFRPMRPKADEVISWYLRLRWREGSPPTYGLTRIEMPHDQAAISQVDAVSAWLLQETRPLSNPDPRYDRLLYPFHMCEQILRSRAPSPVMIETAMSQLSQS